MRFILPMTAILLFAKHIVAQREQETSEIVPDGPSTSNFTYLPKWLLLEKRLKNLSKGFVGNIVPQFVEMAHQRNLSSQCVEQSLQIFDGMEDLKMWAMRFLDSSAKPFDGAIETTMTSLGRYQECVATKVTAEDLGREGIQSGFSGQYCLLTMKPHIPDTRYHLFSEPIDELKRIADSDSALSVLAKYSNSFNYLNYLFGICVPSGCTREDVDQIAAYVGEQSGMIISLQSCEVTKVNRYTPTVIFIMSCYAFIILLVSIGTFLEVQERGRKTPFSSIGIRVLLSFSIIKNFKGLFTTKTAKDQIKCLDGFRVISIAWVLTCHTFLFRPKQITYDVMSMLSVSTTFLGQIILNGTISVDSFFFLTGFLIGYVSKKHKELMGNTAFFPVYIFYRLRRTYPGLLFAVSFIFLCPLLTSGPIWNFGHSAYMETCDQNWWTILVFINNLYFKNDLCVPPYWYVACDMQLYIMTFFFLILIFKKKKFGVAAAVIAIVASIIYIGIITYLKKQPPTATLTVTIDLMAIREYAMQVYFSPFDHLGPYLIGLLSGIAITSKRKIELSKLKLTLGSLLAITLSTSVVFGVLPWNRGEEAGIAEGVIYASCSRVAWAMSLAWLVICCATGHGGIVNYILSWKVWIPLSRLTYIVYLIHPFVFILSTGNADTVLPVARAMLVRRVIADVAITFICAVPVYLTVESPLSFMARLVVPEAYKHKLNIQEISTSDGNAVANTENKLNGSRYVKTDLP